MKKFSYIVITGLLAVSILTGCGKKEVSEQADTPTATVVPTATMAPTATVVPTATMAPTATEAPTATITPTTTEAPAAETVVTLGQYKGLTVYEVDSAVVEAEIQTLLENYAELVPVDRAAIEGDTVNINYVGKKDGVAFEGGTDNTAAGTDLELGSGMFIDGFEDGLIGVVAGEIRDLNLTFPENYGNAELAGQAVVFTVTVNEVKEIVFPEPSDTFAAENLGYGTWSEYELALRESLNETSFYEQVSEQLMASSEIENYPAEKVASEKQAIYDYYYSYGEYYGAYFGLDAETALAYFFGLESLAALEEYAEAYARQLVKNTLVLKEIYEVEQLELSEADFQAGAAQYAASSGYEDVNAFLADYGEETVREVLIQDYVMRYVVSQAIVVKAE